MLNLIRLVSTSKARATLPYVAYGQLWGGPTRLPDVFILAISTDRRCHIADETSAICAPAPFASAVVFGDWLLIKCLNSLKFLNLTRF
jgi:hypothetical protein